MAFTDALIEHADVSVVHGRPPARRGRTLARRVPLRPAPPGLGVLRRGLDAARSGTHAAGRAGGRPARAGDRAGDLRLLRPGAARPDDPLGQGDVLPELRVPRRPRVRVAGLREAVRGYRGRRASSTPATSRPRSRHGRRRRSARPTGCAWWPSTSWSSSTTRPSQYVDRRLGQDRDGCLHLAARQRGVDPDAICWVRPRDPWMLNRAVVQPNPAVFIGMAADILEIAAGAASPDDMFLGMEEAGVMLRIDRSVTPTMAKTPTLATWELDQLRTIENVVRLGHIDHVEPGRLVLGDGEVGIAKDAVVVHCAASGLQYPPMVPIWGDGGDHAAAGPDRLPLLRRGASPDTSRPPATATRRRTGCARRRRTRTRPPTGPACRCWAVGPRCPSRPTPSSRPGPTRPRSTRRASRRTWPTPPSWVPPWTRFRTHVGPGLARMEELSRMSG